MNAILEDMLYFSLWPDIKLNKNDSEYQMFSKYFDIIDKEDVLSKMRQYENNGKKNISESKKFRTYGNEYFNGKEYEKALDSYNESISLAPRESTEFGLALANRSAVFFDMEKYKECLEDINVVLRTEYPKDLLYKIFLRQSKCYLKLNLNIEVAKSLRRAQECTDNLKLGKEQRTSIIDTIKELKGQLKEHLVSNTNTSISDNVPDEYVIEEPTLKDGENPKFLNASKIIDIKYTKKLGRHVVANSDIKKGDVLIIEEPYSHIPKINEMHKLKLCAWCFKETSNYIPCTMCTVYLYCSDNCRQNSWDLGHRWDCFGARRGFVNDEQKLCLSLLFNATQDGFLTDVHDKSIYGSHDNNYPFVDKLVTNKNKVNEEVLKIYIKWAVWLVLYLKNFTDYFDWLNLRPIRPEGSKEELLKFVGGQLVKYFQQIGCNTVIIADRNVILDPLNFTAMNQVISGRGIYVSSALLNHSCIPNSTDSFFGTKRVIRATQDIKRGTEVTISYLPPDCGEFDNGTEEHEALIRKYMFKCSCQLCIDPKYKKLLLTAYLCPRCNGKALISDNVFGKCFECDLEFFAFEYNIIEQKIQELFAILRLFKDYNQLDTIYKLMKKIYHKYSLNFLVYYSDIIKKFNEKGELKNCVDNAKLRIEVSKNIYGNSSVKYVLHNVTCTILLAKYSKNLRTQKSKYYKKYLNETKNMIKTCIDLMAYIMCTDNIKKFVTSITEYLNSDEDDATIENNGFIIEECE